MAQKYRKATTNERIVLSLVRNGCICSMEIGFRLINLKIVFQTNRKKRFRYRVRTMVSFYLYQRKKKCTR